VSEIRVLLVDDSPVVRLGMRRALDSQHGLDVVGEAGDTQSALALAAALRPDVVVLGAELAGLQLQEVRNTLRRRAPDARLLVMGAGGLHASATLEQVRDAVRGVHVGGPTLL
jgi:DNA-binding NarL/FixJ family response regulator